ncbi:hypothetical protein KAU40_02865 [Candidatus Parcubacteria bacterium]|nr:hypothetical protein [Candidatus Parcubacteria bacterium]
MNFEFIVQIVFLFSLLGMLIILFQKIPVLAKLPKVVEQPQKKRNKIKIQSKLFLQKLLSRIRILTLKTDHKTYNWLQKLREKSQKKKFQQDDNYWEKILKSFKSTKKR